jgi:uncharacterized protein (TIGR03083 family)
MGGVEIAAYIEALDQDGALLADAAADAGLGADVPACPGWQVRDLVRHQAYVHGWAARHVLERLPEVLEGATEAEILGGGPADADLIAAYRDGHAALVAALRDADPDLECGTFLAAPSPLAFWARRQAHETAIHRLDAQGAGRAGPPDPLAAFDPAFAADGIDELIMGFAARRRYWRSDCGEVSLAVRAQDTGGAWQVRIADGATEVSRGEATADCVLAGTAAGLYAFLWNRSDAAAAAITITGRPDVLAVWNGSVRVRW